MTVPGKYALVRDTDHKVFDVVGKDWKQVQNSDVAAFFDGFIKAGNLTPHAAGATQEGRNVFFVAKINKSFKFLGTDVNEGLLCFTNPHKHGSCVSVRLMGNRLWCANQIGIDIGGRGDSVRFTHVARNSFRVDLAQKIIGLSITAFDQYEQQAHILAGGKANPAQIETYFRKVWGLEKPGEGTEPKLAKEIEDRNQEALVRIYDAHNNQPGIECGKGTWWHAANSVTYITDHLGRGDEARAFHTAQFGAGAERKRKGLALALEYAKAA